MAERCTKRISDEKFDVYKQQIIGIISSYLPKAKVYLFGSRARGDSRMGSDVDIVLNDRCKIDIKILVKIRDKLEESRIPFFVDIVDLHDVLPDFKSIIEKDMVLWKN